MYEFLLNFSTIESDYEILFVYCIIIFWSKKKKKKKKKENTIIIIKMIQNWSSYQINDLKKKSKIKTRVSLAIGVNYNYC